MCLLWHTYARGLIKIITSSEGVEGNLLEGIAVNMDSFVIKRYISRKRIKNQEQIKQVRDKYCMNSYLHGMFLYAILDKVNKSDNYNLKLETADYVKEILKPYSSVLLSLDTNDAILSSLSDD
jgi:hypothetical protein